jgi:hypothetical protein
MKIIAFLVAFVLFVGGLVIMGYGADSANGSGFLFFAGILAIALSIALPAHLLKRADG